MKPAIKPRANCCCQRYFGCRRSEVDMSNDDDAGIEGNNKGKGIGIELNQQSGVRDALVDTNEAEYFPPPPPLPSVTTTSPPVMGVIDANDTNVTTTTGATQHITRQFGSSSRGISHSASKRTGSYRLAASSGVPPKRPLSKFSSIRIIPKPSSNVIVHAPKPTTTTGLDAQV